MKIKLLKDVGDLRTEISKWIKGIWEYNLDESTLQIGDNAYLQIEWNEEIDYGYRMHVKEYLDIMVVDQSGKWLFPYCYTSYNSKDYDAIADRIIYEVIHEDIQ